MLDTDTMQMVINKVKEKFEVIEKRVVIGIDGGGGVGKTFLSKSVSDELGLPVISLDTYLIPKDQRSSDCYVHNIDLKRLGSDVRTTQSLIIEGVCLLEILRVIKVTCGILIYIKRIKKPISSLYPYEVWLDGDDYDYDGGIEEKIAEGDRVANKFDHSYKVISHTFFKEILRYHQEYKPHNKADIIFKRIID